MFTNKYTHRTIEHRIAREARMAAWEWKMHFFDQSFTGIAKALEIINVSSNIDWIWTACSIQQLWFAHLKIKEKRENNTVNKTCQSVCNLNMSQEQIVCQTVIKSITQPNKSV